MSMIIQKTDQPIKRIVVQVLMIFFGLLAIVPVYVLLINATRSTEQINLGLSILPGRGAFRSITDEHSNITRTKAGEAGTVRFQDIINGVTYYNDSGKNRIVYSIPEGRNPRILVVDENGNTIATYPLPKGSFIEVNDGDKVRQNQPIYKVFPVTAEVSGRVSYIDFIPGKGSTPDSSVIEERDRGGNLISVRVDEYLPAKPVENNKRPMLAITNSENVRTTYILPTGSYVDVKNGEMVQEGQILSKSIRRPVIIFYNWRALVNRGFRIFKGFLNSSIIAISSTALVVYFSALTAYGLHVYRFRGRLAIWALILIIMMLPGSLTFIGFYQLMASWQLTNSYIPLILPGIAAAGAVLFIRQYMTATLSLELVDAARIDGASEFRIFNVIILPITIPALAAQSIFSFVGSWNNFLTPFVLISSQEKYTLPMFVFLLRGDIYRTETGALYLGIAVSLIPIILFYVFMSRFIISGLTMGGIKE
jgi:multiple sugar transport system permease protein